MVVYDRFFGLDVWCAEWCGRVAIELKINFLARFSGLVNRDSLCCRIYCSPEGLILGPTDLKERSDRAVKRAVQIAHQSGSKITLLC